jgi:hypothetical protein
MMESFLMLFMGGDSFLEDDMFPDDEINGQADQDVDDERISCGDAALMNEQAHNGATDENADASHQKEIEHFEDGMMASGFEYPFDIDVIGGEIGKNESDNVVDHRVARAEAIRDDGSVQVQYARDDVIGAQRGEKGDGHGVETDDMDKCGDPAADAVLEDLDAQ